MTQLFPGLKDRVTRYGKTVRTIVEQLLGPKREGVAGDEPVEGGPKAAETSDDLIPSSQLFSEVNLLPDLSDDQR